jgi:hypothetical protein
MLNPTAVVWMVNRDSLTIFGIENPILIDAEETKQSNLRKRN